MNVYWLCANEKLNNVSCNLKENSNNEKEKKCYEKIKQKIIFYWKQVKMSDCLLHVKTTKRNDKIEIK